jgi:hypothetical protein
MLTVEAVVRTHLGFADSGFYVVLNPKLVPHFKAISLRFVKYIIPQLGMATSPQGIIFIEDESIEDTDTSNCSPLSETLLPDSPKDGRSRCSEAEVLTFIMNAGVLPLPRPLPPPSRYRKSNFSAPALHR